MLSCCCSFSVPAADTAVAAILLSSLMLFVVVVVFYISFLLFVVVVVGGGGVLCFAVCLFLEREKINNLYTFCLTFLETMRSVPKYRLGVVSFIHKHLLHFLACTPIVWR